ncbi:MAG: nadB 2 [Dehalococcoidia bacterium]|nr:nadB 2 [Dehalococcoidia bacterium]
MNSMGETGVETIETDVLILGSGMAGLRAAIEARRYGVAVLMIDKSLISINSNTRFSGSAFRAASTAGIGGTGGAAAEVVTLHNYPSDHFKDTLRIGGFLNDQRLAEILCFEVPARVHELADFGLKNLSEMFLHCCYPHGTLTVRSLLETIEKMGVKTIRKMYPLWALTWRQEDSLSSKQNQLFWLQAVPERCSSGMRPRQR